MEENHELTPESDTPPAKEKRCRSAVTLAIIGAIAGLFIPFLGWTFAVAGIYVNYMERGHYETAPGYAVNALSIIISAASWILALMLRPMLT